jgi:hypothetical protein
MYADVNKYFQYEPENIHIQREWLRKQNKLFKNDQELKQFLLDDRDGEPFPGRWYWIGTDNFTDLCQKFKYTVLSKDLGIDKTNPITLFSK